MQTLGALVVAAVAAAYQPVHRPLLSLPRAPPPAANFLSDPAAAGGAADSTRVREGALVKWLESNGVWMSGKAGWGKAAHPLRVESDTVEDFEICGRGLIARKEIVQGENIVRVPSELVMTREAAQRVLGPSVIPDSLNEYLAIAMLLMHERALGDASFWAAYIQLLPTTEDVGQTWTWSDEELGMLTGSGILDSTASLKAKVRREHEMILSEIVTPNGLDPAAYAFEHFEWAMSMLFSRAIDLREVGALALVPYADLLNHSPYAASYFYYEKVPLSKLREVCLYSDRAYAKNDQVRASHTPPPLPPPPPSHRRRPRRRGRRPPTAPPPSRRRRRRRPQRHLCPPVRRCSSRTAKSRTPSCCCCTASSSTATSSTRSRSPSPSTLQTRATTRRSTSSRRSASRRRCSSRCSSTATPPS
jgi:hypothetical protein